jgi:hypothetical protein
MNMTEERLSKRPELEGMYMAGNHTEEVHMDTPNERLSKRLEVEGMDMMDNHMVEDTTPDFNGLKECTGTW